MHICLNIVEVLYSVKVNTNIGTIGGGSNCNWYGVLDVTSVVDPFGADRVRRYDPRTVFTTPCG